MDLMLKKRKKVFRKVKIKKKKGHIRKSPRMSQRNHLLMRIQREMMMNKRHIYLEKIRIRPGM
jgi:hypothetical protein